MKVSKINMNDQEIKNRIAILEPFYRDFIKSEIPNLITSQFSEEYGFNEEKDIVFSNGVVLFLLFFLDKSDFVQFLMEECELNEKEAVLLTEGILLALPEPIRESHQKTRLLISSSKIADSNKDKPTEVGKPFSVNQAPK